MEGDLLLQYPARLTGLPCTGLPAGRGEELWLDTLPWDLTRGNCISLKQPKQPFRTD